MRDRGRIFFDHHMNCWLVNYPVYGEIRTRKFRHREEAEDFYRYAVQEFMRNDYEPVVETKQDKRGKALDKLGL